MSKIELDNITSGYNLGKINANFVKIENALTNNVLFRDATGSTAGPNQMVQDIDMDSQSILNLPTPTAPTNPVRLQDLGDYATSTELTEVDNRLTTLETGTVGDTRYIHWLYNDGSATGGETTINIPYNFTSVATVFINGVRMTYGLAFEYDVTAKTVTFAEALDITDEVVVSLGTEPVQDYSDLVTDVQLAEIQDITKTYIFDNVSDMATSTIVFPIGKILETGGYYTKGDAGQAKYLIVAAQTADGYGDHTLANGTVAVLQIIEKVYHSQFGVVADSDPTDSTVGTDNGLALNAAFSASYDLQKASVLPIGPMRHTIPLIIQKAGANSFTVESSNGGAGYGKSRLMFDADPTLVINKNQCITYGGTMEFYDVGFAHSDSNRNNDTSCVFHTRTDINTKQDIDHKFFNCLFTGAEFVATTYGRGWWCYDSDVSLVRNVLRLEWPAGFDGTLLAPEQQLTTGMRGYRLIRNKIHASANGHLIVNIGYNRKNANNIQVQNNNFDTPMGLLKGSARDSSFDNNLCLYASSVDFFVLNDDKIENVTAKNNYSGVNTTDMNEPFNTVVSNSASIIDGFDFSGSTFSHAARTLFFNSGGSVYGLKINNCTFNDILQANTTAATRYIFSETGGTAVGNVEFVNNTISNYVRTFNATKLFDMLPANCVNIKSHSNSFDVDTVPLLPVQLQGLLSNIHTFLYSGTGSDPLIAFQGTDGRTIKVAIVSERFGGATPDKTFMTNDQGANSDPLYLSADKQTLFAKADCNTLNGYYQVTLIY